MAVEWLIIKATVLAAVFLWKENNVVLFDVQSELYYECNIIWMYKG